MKIQRVHQYKIAIKKGSENMPSSMEDYRNMIEQPWGKMFYDMIYRQLHLSNKKRLKVLDYGAGFCVSADYYGKHHDVTAIEPDTKMIHLRIDHGNYELICGSLEKLKAMKDNTYDIIFCHNVLEYVEDKEAVLSELSRVLKQDGLLSVVKHNLGGRILAYAVFDNDPGAAIEILSNGDNGNNLFGGRHTYSNQYLIEVNQNNGLVLNHIYGIRTFFGLSKDFEAKRSKTWYSDMLELEMKVCDMEQYKGISFFHHLIFTKKTAD